MIQFGGEADSSSFYLQLQIYYVWKTHTFTYS